MLISVSITGLDLGSLRHRVAIEQRADTVDALGDWTNDPSASWTQLRTVYAKVDYINAADQQRLSERFTDARFSVTMRYQPDMQLSDKNRLNWNGKLMQVIGVDDVEGLQIAWTAYCREFQQ